MALANDLVRDGVVRTVNSGVAASKTVRILLFATVRETIGRPELVREVSGAGRTMGELLAELRDEYPRVSALLSSCRFARNGRYVRSSRTRLRPGDELAIHPPFSGG